MTKIEALKSKALVLRKDDDGSQVARIEDLRVGDLPRQGDTLVRVHYSSVNYKDGLAVTDKGKIIRAELPFVPGIDLVGEVVHSSSGSFDPGARVIGTGWGIGENHWGGFSQYQWVEGQWLVHMPPGLESFSAIVAGTAGLTAMLAVRAIVDGGRHPADGPILVTGATGGVGSFAVLFLSRLGYHVAASTGKETEHDYLRELGTTDVIARDELSIGARRPLDSARWSGAVDSVGGSTLESILSAVMRHGVVASCGLAGGARFETTVYPFILRGISLVGIDSNTCPIARRVEAWDAIARTLDADIAGRIGHVHALTDVPELSEAITTGKIRGRAIIDLDN